MRKVLVFILFFSLFFGYGWAQETNQNQALFKDNPSPFGVLEFLPWNHHWNNYKYPNQKSLKRVIDLMKEANVAWVRMDFLWQDIEPEKGEINFDKYDYIVNLLLENNIQILGVLSYSVSWAGKVWNSPPREDETFVNYVAKVIEHYKDKVKYWEIWNEPDEQLYWNQQDGMARYTQLLKKVYTKAKEMDPNCKILNGGLSRTINISLKKIYKNGGKGCFDILAIHPFVNPLDEADVTRIKGIYKSCKKIMNDNGEDKKIWFTELGAPGVYTPEDTNMWWSGYSPNEKQQADWVKRIYTQIIKELPDCEKIFWAFFRDCKNHWYNGVDFFGLIRWDYSKKAGFKAFKEAAQNWQKSQN